MRIGTIREQDYEKLHELYTQLIREESDITDMIRVLEATRDDDHYYLVGAFDEEDILRGTLTLTRCLDLTGDARYYYSMENFVVDEAVRGQGYGAFLIEAAEAFIREHNGAYVNFTSANSRKGAHAFYEKMGYPIDYTKGFKKLF